MPVPEFGLVGVATDPALRAYDFGPGHPFRAESRWLAVRLLEEERFFDPPPQGAGVRYAPAPLATRPELLRFHEEAYLDRVLREGESERPGFLDRGDTPAFEGCYGAAARVVGATLAMTRAVIDAEVRRGFQPSGGLHHARPDRASGFCIFNDVAVTIAEVLRGRRVRRVAYVDIDAHHGDGVMYGFYNDGRVLDIDFHQDGRTLFPGTGDSRETGGGDGAGLKANLALPPGSGDGVFQRCFRAVVPPMIREFRPELVILQSGVDGHLGDRLGMTQLRYTARSYRLAAASLAALADEVCGGRLVVTGGGGYSAENVAAILGRLPWWMSGVLGGPAGIPPEAWRREFESGTGIPAPSEFQLPGTDTSADRSVAERIVGELGGALGRSFAVDGPDERVTR